MKHQNLAVADWSELIRSTAEIWHNIEMRPAEATQLSAAYQQWQHVLSASSSSVFFDSTPVDFTVALRQAAQFEVGPLTAFNQQPAAVGRASASTSILEMDLTEVATLIAQGDLTSVEVTKLSLQRLEQVNESTNACVAIEAEAALKKAAIADEQLRLGQALAPLHGVPLAHKDLFYLSDTHASAGWCGIQPRKARLDVRPDSGRGNAVAIEQLTQAGAINLGRLHMTEFAFDPSGLNSELGPCHNPWNLNCVPGGSSSGSAVVVAARAVFGALGSDTGGSIRIPASLCGITGLKPTYGLVSTQGAMPLSHSNDHIGPLARSAADCAALMRVIADPSALDSASYLLMQKSFEAIAQGAVASLTGLRIGVPTRFYKEGLAPEINAVMSESLNTLQEMGASIREVPDAQWEVLNVLGAVITRAEAAARVARLKLVGGLHPEVMTRFMQGVAIPGAFYVQALNERGQRLRAFLHQIMTDIDVLHLPVCRIHTPTIEAFGSSAEHAAYLRSELTILNRTFNYLGLPGLSLPAGFVEGADRKSMPVGIQLVGKPYADARLLAIGAAWQQATSWHRERPQ